jgi:hypothetical protein
MVVADDLNVQQYEQLVDIASAIVTWAGSVVGPVTQTSLVLSETVMHRWRLTVAHL